jgi:hypothetical protein
MAVNVEIEPTKENCLFYALKNVIRQLSSLPDPGPTPE